MPGRRAAASGERGVSTVRRFITHAERPFAQETANFLCVLFLNLRGCVQETGLPAEGAGGFSWVEEANSRQGTAFDLLFFSV